MLPRGTVIKIFLDSIVDPHDKYIVILGRDTPKVTYAGVLINSIVNINVNCTQELLNHQVEISTANNTFLHHTSHINCAVIKYLSCEEIDKAVAANPAIIVGTLHIPDHTTVKNIIRDSNLHLPHVKKAYGLG